MISIERDYKVQPLTTALIILGSIVAALFVGAMVLNLGGYDPLRVYGMTYPRVYLTSQGIFENLVIMPPLVLCALGVAVPAKAGIWNIGIEGQFYAGATAATGIALSFPQLSSGILIPLMALAAVTAAGMLAMVCVFPRIYFGVSELTTTLLMNYVVILFVRYMVFVKWKDPTTYAVQTREFSQAARLPLLIPSTRVHVGLLVAILVAIGVYWFLKYSVWGYETRAIGDNPVGARYAGIKIFKYFKGLMFVSGALAGLAGMLEVSGVVHRLQEGISAGYGFSAFTISWISMLSAPVIVVTSYFFSGLIAASFTMQMLGLPAPITLMLKGAILIIVLSAQLLVNYRIRWRHRAPALASSGPGEGMK